MTLSQPLMRVPEKVYDRDWAGMAPMAQRSFISENGFLVVPQAFSPAEVENILREIEEHSLEDTKQDMMDAFCAAPSFASMIDNPKILSAVEAAFGPDVVCFKGAYVPKKSKPKGEQVRRTALHMDYGIGEGQSDYRNSNALWVNVACYLTDMTFEHAPFAVVPGSNHRYHLVPGTDMEEMKDEAVTILAKAGDAVLFLHNTAHAGGVNVSGTTQHILFCSYRPRWARPIGRVVEWPKTFLAKAPPDRRRLIENINSGTLQRPPSVLQRIREAVF